VHIPWCVRKCPYCDFNSHVENGALPEEDYLKALVVDLDLDRSAAQHRELRSIFFGGGTPSLLSPQTTGAILEAANIRFAFSTDIEITLEANPGTVEQQRFKDFRSVGINRLSLGIQSLNARHLQTLGRIHDREQAINAVRQARKAGFEN